MRFLRKLAPSLLVLSTVVGARAATYVVPKDEVLIDRSDAIVIARALHSHVQESTERGIETFTVFAVEEVLKGDTALANGIRVREPGGMIETKKGEMRAKLVPGAPRFVDGNHVLLFVRKVGAEDFATTDFGLGSFAFATDDLGNRVVVRDETEIVGRDPDGSLHHEPRRDADRFLGFIRGVVNHQPVADNYTIKVNAPAGDSHSTAITHLQPRPLTVFTATQYTLPNAGTENGTGARWKTFPVNFNRGNAETNDGNNGSDAVNTAFSAWNGDANSNVNYILATTTANSNGITDVADGVNNIVFEKDLTSVGVAAFSCQTFGVVGIGGISNSTPDATNTVNSEVFARTTEADVSMNQGVGACLPNGQGTFSLADFNSDVTHEFGHTLGFRHSNQSRLGSVGGPNNGQACTTQANYDCEMTTAIMMNLIPSGLAATLQLWDHRAVAALYPGSGSPPAAPTNVVATATSTTSVSITWTASAGATSYNVLRTANNSTYPTVGTPATNSFTDNSASAHTAYLYKVTATGPGGTSADSNKDLATTVIFADDPLVQFTTTVQAVHVTQLRTAINAVRKLANGGVANNFNYTTDPTITATTTTVKRLHIISMRNALNPARATLGLTPPLVYTDTTITVNMTLVKAVHFTELRNGVK